MRPMASSPNSATQGVIRTTVVWVPPQVAIERMCPVLVCRHGFVLGKVCGIASESEAAASEDLVAPQSFAVSATISMTVSRVLPQSMCNGQRIDIDALPPCNLCAMPMQFAVMAPA